MKINQEEFEILEKYQKIKLVRENFLHFDISLGKIILF